jgi:hypothetical protein
MDEAAGSPLSPEQIEEFWDLCDSQLFSADDRRWSIGEEGAHPAPEDPRLETEREARRLWALAEGCPGGAEAVLRGAPFHADYFLFTLATLSGEKWSTPDGEHRVFRVARWLLSLRGADGSRWAGFAPEALLRATRPHEENPAVGAFVVSVADGEGHAWTPKGAALRAAALARNASAGEAFDPRAVARARRAAEEARRAASLAQRAAEAAEEAKTEALGRAEAFEQARWAWRAAGAAEAIPAGAVEAARLAWNAWRAAEVASVAKAAEAEAALAEVARAVASVASVAEAALAEAALAEAALAVAEAAEGASALP